MTDYTYNTENPIGSTDVRDGVDNLKSFDVLLNSTDDAYQDRLGDTVPTAAGAIKRLGPVVTAWTFTAGGTLNYPNEAALNPVDGNYYGWTGAFPKAVAPSTDPTLPGSGYVPRTDVVLRNELAQPNGFNLVGGAAADSELQPAIAQIDAVYPHRRCDEIAKRLGYGEAITLACFGDSTMYGYLVGGATSDVQDPKNPPAALAATMSTLSLVVSVINAAISGSDLEVMLSGGDNVGGLTYEQRIAPGGIAASAHVVYCNHGINNCQSNLSIDTYRTDLIRFVQITRQYGKIPVLVTPTPLTVFSNRSTQILMYVNVMREVSVSCNCDLVDNYAYTKASAKKITETVLVPDGIHPSSDLYYQCGRNLAIPLVSTVAIKAHGDIAGIHGTSWYSNMIAPVSQRDETKTGFAMIGTRAASETSTYIPVIFDEPVSYLSFMALQWPDGATFKGGIAGNATSAVNAKSGKSYGSLTQYKWDTEFPCKINAMAGLNVVYFSFDMSDTRPANETLAYSGLVIPSQSGRSGIVPITADADFIKDFSFGINERISFSYKFAPDATAIPTFVDSSGAVAAKLKVVTNGDMYLDFYADGAVVTSTLVSGSIATTEKTLGIEIAINADSIKFSACEQTGFVTHTVATTNTMPPMCLSNIGCSFDISYQ